MSDRCSGHGGSRGGDRGDGRHGRTAIWGALVVAAFCLVSSGAWAQTCQWPTVSPAACGDRCISPPPACTSVACQNAVPLPSTEGAKPRIARESRDALCAVAKGESFTGIMTTAPTPYARLSPCAAIPLNSTGEIPAWTIFLGSSDQPFPLNCDIWPAQTLDPGVTYHCETASILAVKSWSPPCGKPVYGPYIGASLVGFSVYSPGPGNPMKDSDFGYNSGTFNIRPPSCDRTLPDDYQKLIRTYLKKTFKLYCPGKCNITGHSAEKTTVKLNYNVNNCDDLDKKTKNTVKVCYKKHSSWSRICGKYDAYASGTVGSITLGNYPPLEENTEYDFELYYAEAKNASTKYKSVKKITVTTK